MSDWCILRTKGSSTLRLARSLNDGGIEAWTPTEVQVRRPRQGGERTERIVSVMPTYVFARSRHLHDLIVLSERETSPSPDFSILHHPSGDGRIGFVDDRELYWMRQVERKASAKGAPVVFTKGQSVRVPDGPYQAMTGQVIEAVPGKWVVLAFPEYAIPVKFAAWTLSEAA